VKNNIQKIIDDIGWNQPKLASLVGVKREYINRIINNHITPTIPLGIRIAKALGRTVEDVFILDS
jgi:putative transcriptional regulator